MARLETDIKPSEIFPDRRRLMGQFGWYEAEKLASMIIQLCQKRGDKWQPIPEADLSQAMDRREFWQGRQRLIQQRYLTATPSGLMVTVALVEKCHQVAPATGRS